MRLDAYLAQYYPEYSRSIWQKYIKLGFVRVNGKMIISPKYNLGEDDEVMHKVKKIEVPNIELPVIYEDDNVVVINKLAGILSHSKGGFNNEATVASWLYPKLAKDWRLATNNHQANRLGIVHRLDRATSGVMICAKNEQSQKWLQKQFSTRKTKKTYYAIVEGHPRPEEAVIDAPIARNPKKPQTFSVQKAGKLAQTAYKVIKTSIIDGRQYCLVELKPVTGRTHQLRVHMSYIGNPIVGDRVYGDEGEHMYLCAHSLEITLPSRQRKVFNVPIPKIFEEFMGK